MARIFITGSAEGLGQLAARSLIDKGNGWPSRRYTFRLHKKDKRSRGRTIAASSFFNRYGIRPTETAAFLNPIVTDAAIMALGLNDAVPTGKKGK